MPSLVSPPSRQVAAGIAGDGAPHRTVGGRLTPLRHHHPFPHQLLLHINLSSTTNPSTSNFFSNPLFSFIQRQTPLHRRCRACASPVVVSAR